ncbi:MAG: bifunctional oligoribonuclease/PAP phosphatase NrnA [Patescibacteria group bacterium]
MENQAVLFSIARLFDEAGSILLTAADNLDGDALGCLLALEAYGRAKGKEIDAVNSRPVCPLYDFLGVSDRIKTTIPDKKYDLVIICDTGDISMIGRLYVENRELFDNTPILNIDHHGSCYGDICWMDPSYSAACDMVAEFLEYHGGISAITPEVANFLFLGILYDTGCYRNTNTLPSTFERSAKLLARGADYMSLIRNLYQSTPVSYAKIYGAALSSIFEVGGGKGIGTVVTLEDFEKNGVSPYALGHEFVNDYVRSIKADFVFLIKEDPEGGVRISFRSKKDDVDVRIIAAEFGGGGHKMAAGGASSSPLSEVVAKIDEFARKLP